MRTSSGDRFRLVAQHDLSIVVPAYNEAARIGRCLLETRAFIDSLARSCELIIVDDGSRDRTAAIVEAHAKEDPRIRLIQFPQNRGKGAAVRTGVLASNGTLVLFMDADLATPLTEFAKLERAIENGADFAFGSRASPESNILVRQHPLREAMGRTFNVLVRMLTIGGYKDTQCGFKMMRRSVADDVFSQATVDRFAFDVELLMLAYGRYQLAEVPVAWRHVDESKVSPIRDAPQMLIDLVRLRFLFALRRWNKD